MGRAAAQQMKIFPAEGGFRVMRRTAPDHAERMVRLGAWRYEYDQCSGRVLGCRVIGADTRVDDDLRSMPTEAAITEHEMQLNLARSETRGLSEVRRLERIANGEAPEDEVERVQAKVRVYVHVNASRGDILRVWPRS